ncbi:MAG TPA: amidohydrolase family protein [Jatrophihabitans sp.]|jgi:predicted TIM-barrel fold metal-dependent hydrolase
MIMGDGSVDIHQHLWPESFIEELRLRSKPPNLVGWTLHTSHEQPYAVTPAHHDVALRVEADSDVDQVLLSMSTPLGVAELAPDEATTLLKSWHDGVAELGAPFRAWASVCNREPDLHELKELFARGFVGLQIGADQLATPAAIERIAALLEVCQNADVPVLVHPGAVGSDPAARDEAARDKDARDGAARDEARPAWWSAVVDYPTQMQAAWWSWFVAGRTLLPALRICFAAGAGLAPAHAERFVARSGQPFRLDRDVFLDTSSYGPRGLDSLVRILGVDTLVFGTDRPYAEPTDPRIGPEATRAIRVSNPHRLLKGDQPLPRS